MSTLYFDVSAGAAGDMLLAALFELCPDHQGFLDTMNALPLPGIRLRPEPAEDHGVCGTHMSVAFHGVEEGPGGPDHHHHHGRHLGDVLALIESFPLPREVLEHAAAVYEVLAQAEARAHGQPVGEIHFHEVGTNDAIADITGVSLLIHMLKPARILATPIAVGSGTVHCAHGELPVPAPATAFLLEGLPTVPGAVAQELCTPTGAALLRHFAEAYGPLPALDAAVCGRGMGSKRFPQQVNAVTAYLAP